MLREFKMLVVYSNTGGKDKGGGGGNKGYKYSSSCELLVQLVLLVNEHKTAQPSSWTTTRHLMNAEPGDKT